MWAKKSMTNFYELDQLIYLQDLFACCGGVWRLNG